MNWIDFCWPVAIGACLAMGLIHLWIGLRGASRRANLLFALSALLTATYSFTEMRMFLADDPAEYLARLRWLDLAAGAMTVSLVLFVWNYFGTGRKWLGILGIASMGLAMTADLGPVPQLVFREFTGIQMVTTFGGVTYPLAEGVASPWNALFYLSCILQMAFVADASITTWRHGERRRAAVVGGTIVVFYLLGGLQAALVDMGVLRTPYLVTFIWLIILGAMTWELTRELLWSAQISKELHDTQERMQLATTAVDLGVWEWDIGRDEFWLSDISRRRLGVGSAERVTFSRFLQPVHPDDRERTEREVRHALASQHDLEVKYRAVTAKGVTLSMVALGRVERGGNGKALRVRGVSIDNTRREQAKLETQELRRSLEHSGRVGILGELTASLAHELNQPLAAILANAQAVRRWLAGGHLDLEELRSVIEDIIRDDKRAGEIVHRVRALARKDTLERGWLVVNTLVHETAALLRSELIDADVPLTLDLQPDLPAIEAGHVELQQSLLNLMLNGLQAQHDTERSQRGLFVTTRSTGDTVILSVRDRGPGISPDVMARLFESFFTTKPGGLGLGLAFCRRSAETHGGRLWAENHRDGGAAFFLSLPVKEQPAS